MDKSLILGTIFEQLAAVSTTACAERPHVSWPVNYSELGTNSETGRSATRTLAGRSLAGRSARLLGCPWASESASMNDVTGKWHSLFSYPHTYEPTGVVAELSETDVLLTGLITEQGLPPPPLWL